MEERKGGRPKVPADKKKKPRNLSFTDTEFIQLMGLAAKSNCNSVSSLIVQKFDLK